MTEMHVRRRVLVLLGLLVCLFVLLVVRIACLTTVRSAELTERGVRQWTREGVVYARRGEIQDTNGYPLVMSATAYIVSANPRKITDMSLFAQTICPILDLSEEAVLRRISDRSRASVTLKRQVSREKADELRKMQQGGGEAAVQLEALLFDEDVRRVYPRGAFLSQTLGLTNVDSVGQSGLEAQYEPLLRGTAGRSLRAVDGYARPIYDSGNLYSEPQDGSTLVLTIDASIQEVCEKAMRECYAVNRAQAVHCIAMDPYTGEILAMCSKPDYDPNNPPREQADALQRLMRICLISDAYEPGSTFKILTAAAALDAGVTTPDDPFYCSAKIVVDGDTIRCWGKAHQDQTMAKALQNSCNPVFVELALRLGTDRFYQYLHAFGLGSKTDIDLQGEGSGILIPARNVKNVDLARIGFGQSVAVTPIQLLTAACSVINGGRLMQPYLLKEAVSPEGEVIFRAQPRVTANPITEETSALMRRLLEAVVSEGGARNAAVAGYRVGGKTGTAQVYRDGRIARDVHIGSFLGFAPADDPRIALLVIVDEADAPVDYGGTTAAPFAGQILADVLPYLGCRSSDAAKPQMATVEDVVGLPLSQARYHMARLGYSVLVDGAGDTVTAQMPGAGAQLAQGSQVMLYTYTQDVPRPEDLVCVPDVSGMGSAQAASVLRQRGLEMEMTAAGFAVRQEPMAGSFVPQGTVIRVTFEMPGS